MLVGAAGRRVRAGALIRTGALGRLTDDDLPVLAKLGLACVVDLRDSSEIAVAPADRLAGDPRVVHLPVHDPEHPVFTYVSAVLLGHDLEAYRGLALDGTPAAMAAIYRWFVTDPSARAGFAAAVRLAADPANLPLLFHCTAGKDRTGWLSVILLTALGVDECGDPGRLPADQRADREPAGGDPAGDGGPAPGAGRRSRSGRCCRSARSTWTPAYAQVESSYGTFDGYLTDGLGLTPETLTALRTHLLS